MTRLTHLNISSTEISLIPDSYIELCELSVLYCVNLHGIDEKFTKLENVDIDWRQNRMNLALFGEKFNMPEHLCDEDVHVLQRTDSMFGEMYPWVNEEDEEAEEAEEGEEAEVDEEAE
jgi:hypothetical protein